MVIFTIPCERNPGQLESCKLEVWTSPFITGNMGHDVIKQSMEDMQNSFYNIAYLAGCELLDRLKGYNWDRINTPHPLATVTQAQAAALAADMSATAVVVAMPSNSSGPPSSHSSIASSSAASSSAASSSTDPDDGPTPSTYSKDHPVPMAAGEGAENTAAGFKRNYRQPGGVQRFSGQRPNYFFDYIVESLKLSDTEIYQLRLMVYEQTDPTTWYDWMSVNVPKTLTKGRETVDALLSTLGSPDEFE